MILRRQILAMSLVTLLGTDAIPAPDNIPIRVLFLGNSITYVGNLPAVFSALCNASGVRCIAEMIVRGGGTLTDRIADKSLDRAVAKAHFDYLILQERGGDLIGFPDETATKQAQSAAGELAQDARRLRMRPILLGTYQPPPASEALVAAESALAKKLGVEYVAVSNYLACGRRVDASLRWFQSDGMHPGPELTLLMAVLLHRKLLGSYPPVAPIEVRAPIYGAASGLTADTFASAQALRPGLTRLMAYDTATVKAIIALSQSRCG